MKNLNDESLVALFAQGNNEAFDELLRRHKNDLFSYIYGAVQNRSLAEDIFQDTFTKVIVTVKGGHYQEMGRFVGFIFRVAHNLIVDNYRQEQSSQLVSECDLNYDLFGRREVSSTEFDDSLEDVVSYRQVLRDVRHLVMFLPEPQQQIVKMRFYKNMAFKDIADELGISINTALGRIRYAVMNMRKLAEQHNISLAV